MKVKNIGGIEHDACEGCSWLRHWIKFSRSKSAGLCKEADCINIAKVGALVQMADSNDDGWYIVPLCEEHANMKRRTLELFGSPRLVPAKIEKSCANHKSPERP